MAEQGRIQSLVVMGVSGSGKSTIGKLLAEKTRFSFTDADDLHPAANKAQMAAGIPLTDESRIPWLRIIGELFRNAEQKNIKNIVACSALKRSYRDLLREYSPELFFVFLDGTKVEIQERLYSRNHEFMPASLLDSQFANLEPLQGDERGIKIAIRGTPEQLVREIQEAL